jgi:hypothetical protein
MKRINLEKLFALGIILILLTSTFLIFIPKIEAQNRFSGKGSGTLDEPYVITNGSSKSSLLSKVTLTITNIPGKTLPPGGGTFTVIFYDAKWNYVTSYEVDYKGGETSAVLEVSLTYGEYNIELYHKSNNTKIGREMWGQYHIILDKAQISAQLQRFFSVVKQFDHNIQENNVTINTLLFYQGLTASPWNSQPYFISIILDDDLKVPYLRTVNSTMKNLKSGETYSYSTQFTNIPQGIYHLMIISYWHNPWTGKDVITDMQYKTINIQVTTQKSVIFTGIVQNIQSGAFKVKVDEVIYGKGLQNGNEINVIYDIAKTKVFLGSLSIGDKVIVYGKLGINGVYVNSSQYGIVNLKYVEAKHFENVFSKFKRDTVSTPFSSSPVENINFQFLFETSSELSITTKMVGDYYAISRGGTPGILKIMPLPSSGEYTFTISLQLSVNEFQFPWSKTWDQILDITLGKKTSIVFDRIPIPVGDIGVASVEVGITPILTFIPTIFGCVIKSQGALRFSEKGNLTDNVLPLEWTSNTPVTVPLIFTSDGGTSITCNPYIVFTLELKVEIDTKIKTIIGELPFDLGRLTLYSVNLPWDLEPQGLELAKFNPYYLLLIKMPSKLVKATIDGLPENPDETGRIIKLLESGKQHVIEVPKIVNVSNTERMVFVNWTNGVTENKLTLSFMQDTEYSLFYKTQFKLTIVSGNYGTVNPLPGEHWIDANSSVTITAIPFNGCILKDWVIDGIPQNRNDSSLNVVMNRPHKIEVLLLDVTPPLAKAGQNRIIRQGETVILDASNSTDNIGIVSYEWDFGDGTKGFGKTVNHIYEKPGTYKVTLTVKDVAGNYATDSIIITVQSAEIPLWIIVGIAIAIVTAIVATVLILKKKRKGTHEKRK